MLRKLVTIVVLLCLALLTPIPASAVTEKRIAVMLVNFADDNRQPWTASFIDSLYDGTGKSVAEFWDDASWGGLSVSSDVFGWYTLSVTMAQCPSSQNAITSQADAAATAAGVNLSLYTNRVYLWPANSVSGCRSGGQMPGTLAWISLPTTCNQATGICGARANLMHEFGHNLGLDHAGNPAGELGDTFSVMGCCSTPLISNIHRAYLGYIPPSQVTTVTADTTVTVTPANSAVSTVYRVPIGDGEYVYLENRAERTIWENGPGVWPGGKLLLRTAPDYTVRAKTILLDVDPSTANPQSVGLPIGASHTIGDVTITNLAFDGVNNTVQIEVSC